MSDSSTNGSSNISSGSCNNTDSTATTPLEQQTDDTAETESSSSTLLRQEARQFCIDLINSRDKWERKVGERVPLGNNWNKIGSLFKFAAQDERLRNRWMSDATWTNVLHDYYQIHDYLGGIHNFTTFALNQSMVKAFGRTEMDDYTESNVIGVYRGYTRIVSRPNKSKGKTTCYFVTSPGSSISRPSTLDDDWWRESLQPKPDLAQGTWTRKRMRPPRRDSDDGNYDSTSSSSNNNNNNNNNNASCKRPNVAQLQQGTNNGNTNTALAVVQVPIHKQTFWDSTDARKLFGAKEHETVQDLLQRRIQLLTRANATCHGWKDVIYGHDHEGLCTPNQIWTIQQKSMYLCAAYKLCLERMPAWTWSKCAQETIRLMQRCGCSHFKGDKAVQSMNAAFRTSNLFPAFKNKPKKKNNKASSNSSSSSSGGSCQVKKQQRCQPPKPRKEEENQNDAIMNSDYEPRTSTSGTTTTMQQQAASQRNDDDTMIGSSTAVRIPVVAESMEHPALGGGSLVNEEEEEQLLFHCFPGDETL